HSRGELVEQRAADRRLARPDPARQLYETTPLQSVDEVGERLPVPVAQEEVSRVGREGERPLGQPEMRGIHAATLVNRGAGVKVGDQLDFSIFAQVSRSPTVRLKTKCPGDE